VPDKATRADVCILGGGIAGLSAALTLSERSTPHVVLEKATELGGILRSVGLADTLVDRFYHHIFTHDRHTLALLDTLGLHQELGWHSTRLGMNWEGHLFEISNPLKFILGGPFRFSERIALLSAMQRMADIADPAAYDNQTAASFLEEFCGPKLTQKVFLPLLKAKFGTAVNNTSAAFLIGRIAARAKSRRRIAFSERLGYLEGGYQTLLNRLVERLSRSASRLETSARVVSLGRRQDHFRVIWEREGELHELYAKAIVNTLPIPIFLRLAQNPPPQFALRLESIRYQGVVALVLAVDRSIAPFYWTTVVDKDVPFSVVVEHTRFHAPKHYGGNHILYLSQYLSKTAPLWGQSDREIFEQCLEGLFKLFPHISKARVRDWKVSREEFATPMYDKGFLQKIPPQETPWTGLFSAGSIHVYPVIASGQNAAMLSQDFLAHPPSSVPQQIFQKSF
jgi:protoporphyrinogen oxidase